MPYIKRIVNATTVLLISFVAYRFYYPTQMASKVLFNPLKLGAVTLSHRVVLAPLTRYRADENHVHHEVSFESQHGLLLVVLTRSSRRLLQNTMASEPAKEVSSSLKLRS